MRLSDGSGSMRSHTPLRAALIDPNVRFCRILPSAAKISLRRPLVNTPAAGRSVLDRAAAAWPTIGGGPGRQAPAGRTGRRARHRSGATALLSCGSGVCGAIVLQSGEHLSERLGLLVGELRGELALDAGD